MSKCFILYTLKNCKKYYLDNYYLVWNAITQFNKVKKKQTKKQLSTKTEFAIRSKFFYFNSLKYDALQAYASTDLIVYIKITLFP